MNPIGVVLLVLAGWAAAAAVLALGIGMAIRTADRHRPRRPSLRTRASSAFARVVTLATGSIPTIHPRVLATGSIPVVRID